MNDQVDVDPLTQQAFWMAVTRNGRAGCIVCQLKGKDYGLAGGLRCSGQKQAHHVPPFTKARLRGVHSPIPSRLTMLTCLSCGSGNVRAGGPQGLDSAAVTCRECGAQTTLTKMAARKYDWNPQDLAVADPRIGLPVRWIHHESLESGAIELHPHELLRVAGEANRFTFDPVGFARDWGLESWLPGGML